MCVACTPELRVCRHETRVGGHRHCRLELQSRGPHAGDVWWWEWAGVAQMDWNLCAVQRSGACRRLVLVRQRGTCTWIGNWQLSCSSQHVHVCMCIRACLCAVEVEPLGRRHCGLESQIGGLHIGDVWWQEKAADVQMDQGLCMVQWSPSCAHICLGRSIL